MKCIGCDEAVPAVYGDLPQTVGMMHKADLPDASYAIDEQRGGAFCAVAICQPCYLEGTPGPPVVGPDGPGRPPLPTHRKRAVKAHFFTADQFHRALGAAGSSSGIGG